MQKWPSILAGGLAMLIALTLTPLPAAHAQDAVSSPWMSDCIKGRPKFLKETGPDHEELYKQARREERQGAALIFYLIGKDGVTSNFVTLISSGHSDFDEAGKMTAAGLRYRPGGDSGKPEVCPRTLQMRFMTGRQLIVPKPNPVVVMQMKAADFPAGSQAAGEHGDSAFMLMLDDDKNVTSSNLIQSSGYPRLDEAALALGLERWRQSPRLVLNGKPLKYPQVALVAIWPKQEPVAPPEP